MNCPVEDNATKVLEKINLLEIKNSVHMLCHLEDEIMDEFVNKYSSVIIFFLKILDRKRSESMLSSFTDESLIYIMEEEIRILLLHELGGCGEDFEKVSSLMTYFDLIDMTDPEALANREVVPDSEDALVDNLHGILHILMTIKYESANAHFSYFKTFSRERFYRLIKKTAKHNLYLALGIMILSQDEIMFSIMDTLIINFPQIISSLPYKLYYKRFRNDYSLYQEEHIYSSLPDSVQELITYLNYIRSTIIEKFVTHSTGEKIEAAGNSRCEDRLSKVKKILTCVDKGLHEILLSELIHRGIIINDDIPLIYYSMS